ncbi:MAG: DUF1015 domain-containing protein [Lachnospiraceae bacterium]|nr:DUF1015 domain-containing protein [Lachnospiraceae bacterium]
MADIRPFRAYRPVKEKTAEIASLPYDVFSREEARVYVAEHPGCFLAIDRPETQFPPDADMYAPKVYQEAHDLLWKLIHEGTFVQEDVPCYYLYEQSFRGRTQCGIVAVASIDDYENGVIKKHENTREEKEQDRIRHVDVCNAQTGPIFLCYRRNESLSALIADIREEEPAVAFEGADGSTNRVFVISDEMRIKTIQEAFASMNAVYIADGHHRCASAVKVGLQRREMGKVQGELPSDHFLSVLFADNELEILDYNRVVKDLNGLTPEEFLQALRKGFDVEPWNGEANCFADVEGCPKPHAKGCISMYLGEKWYLLSAHPSIRSIDAVDGLDVSLLQKHVLTPILGIEDPRTDARIDFVGGIRGLKELERRCKEDAKVAFAMCPTLLQDLFRVADEGRLMPPKSTWFEPKLLSGLFIHTLEVL